MPHRCRGKKCRNSVHLQVCETRIDICKQRKRVCYKCHYMRINNSEILNNKIKGCQPRYGLSAYNRLSAL